MNKYTQNFRNISDSLIFSEKVILMSSLVWFISTFLTWFSAGESSHNAYNWIWAVMWYFYSIFMICCILLILLKVKNQYLSSMLKRQNWIYLFLVGQSLFISVCSLLIYYSYWFSSPYSNVWVWLYLAIISQVAGLFWAHYFLISYYWKRS